MKPESIHLPDHALLHFPEPRLRFAHHQALADPKDGLLLFGPPTGLDGIRYGVIGTQEGIDQLTAWVQRLAGPILADPGIASSVMFPGFEAIFRTQLNPVPRVTLRVDDQALSDAINKVDPYQRVYDAVELFAGPMRIWVTDESQKVALWFVVVPELLWKQCRPKSVVPKTARVSTGNALSHRKALALLDEPDLFEDVNEAAEKHLY